MPYATYTFDGKIREWRPGCEGAGADVLRDLEINSIALTRDAMELHRAEQALAAAQKQFRQRAFDRDGKIALLNSYTMAPLSTGFE